jgi:hypothetical protein
VPSAFHSHHQFTEQLNFSATNPALGINVPSLKTALASKSTPLSLAELCIAGINKLDADTTKHLSITF